jgi:hypothetical protein
MSPARTPPTLFAAIDAPMPLGGDGPGQRNDEVGIVVPWVQSSRAEVQNLVPRFAQRLCQLFFQCKPAMVRGDSNLHQGGSL